MKAYWEYYKDFDDYYGSVALHYLELALDTAIIWAFINTGRAEFSSTELVALNFILIRLGLHINPKS